LLQQSSSVIGIVRRVAEELGATEQAAWRAFLRAHAALVSTLERELAREGLPITFYDVLAQLSDAGGRLRMRELADGVLLSRSGLTRLIDRMEQSGYVRREQCADDRRGAFAAITPSGRHTLRNARPVHARGIAEHFARHLTRQETDVLTGALQRVADSQPKPPG